MVVHAYNLITGEVKAKLSEVHGQLWLHSELETCLRHMRPHFNQTKHNVQQGFTM